MSYYEEDKRKKLSVSSGSFMLIMEDVYFHGLNQLKIKTSFLGTGDVAKLVECLLGMHDSLGSMTSTDCMHKLESWHMLIIPTFKVETGELDFQGHPLQFLSLRSSWDAWDTSTLWKKQSFLKTAAILN